MTTSDITFKEVMWKRYGMAHIVASDDPHRVLCGSNTYAGLKFNWDRWWTPESDEHRCRKCVKKMRERGGAIS